MNESREKKQVWLELPPFAGGKPSRLLIFLHGAGSRPETFMPVALAWQFKFPSATAIILEGLHAARTGNGRDWFDSRGLSPEQALRAQEASHEVAARIASAQQSLGIAPDYTAVIGFSQGAQVALELALHEDSIVQIVVVHAGRLLRPLPPGTTIAPCIHLLHGEFDTHVLAHYARRTYRSLRDAGARVSLDILAEGVHSIGQDMINIGTTRTMQTLFRGRKRISLDQFHVALALSLDSIDADDTPTVGVPAVSGPFTHH